jgi:hypothetical protein
MVPNPATFGLFLYCGMSGTIVQTITSGMLVQRIGKVLRSGVMQVNIGDHVTSGLDDTFYGTF